LFCKMNEDDVDNDGLLNHFVKNVATPVVVVAKEVAVKKPMVWEATEKKDSNGRRQEVSIQLKAWNVDAAGFLLERLQKCELLQIRNDPDFREDRFQQLSQLVREMNASGGPEGRKIGGIEWQRIGENRAGEKYDWDRNVEGLLCRLQNIHNFKDRIEALELQVHVDHELGDLEGCANTLQHGMDSVLDARVLKSIFGKILNIGNRLNATEAKFNRADGFDVIHLLESSDFLQSYKGPEGISLLRHIQMAELEDPDFESLGELAQALQDISYKKSQAGKEDEGIDPTDLKELRNRVGEIERSLGNIGKMLDSEQKQLSELPGGQKEKRQIQEFTALVLLNRQRSMKVGTDLDKTDETLSKFHRFLAHEPQTKKALVAGRSLGVVANFVRTLLKGKPKKRKTLQTQAVVGSTSSAGAIRKRFTVPGNTGGRPNQ